LLALCAALFDAGLGASCGPAREPEPHAESSVKSLPLSRQAITPRPNAVNTTPATSAIPALGTTLAPTAIPLAPAGRSAHPAQQDDEVERALAYDPNDPLGELESADALDRMASGNSPSQAAKTPGKPPSNGCVVVEPGQRVWPSPGPAAIATIGESFVVAGYAMHDGHEQLFLVRTTLGSKPEPITAFEVAPPSPSVRKAPPALSARDENDVSVAFVDGTNRLWVRRLRLGRAGNGAAIEVASGLDSRFAPTLAHQQDRTLVAWTVGSTPMRTELAALSSEDSILARTDVTPSAMGAAAATFVSGASPPVLIAVDARNGMSPLLRIELDNSGTAKPAEVALPVSMVSSPPRLAAASNASGTYVAYAGLGAAAKSAIGLVSITKPTTTPLTMVPGTAYGPLQLASAAASHAVFFAVDAPIAPGNDPRREIHVHVVSAKGMGAATVIRGPGSAANAAVAHGVGGEIAVAFTSPSGVYVAHLRCDVGG
jgi:hypothetical protein